MEAGRSVVFVTLLTRHAAWDEGDRATWPSVGLLLKTVKMFGVSGPRRVHDMVGRLIEVGYIASVAVPADRRVHVLVPTDKMLAHDLDWVRAYYAPLAVMFPDPGYRLPMRHVIQPICKAYRVGRRLSRVPWRRADGEKSRCDVFHGPRRPA